MPQTMTTMTTNCLVSIIAPDGRRFGYGADPGDDEPLANSLLAVETGKDMAQACGSFTLTLDARPARDGRRWAERIPMRSLVFIVMERHGTTMPEVNPIVMLGFVDTLAVQEQYSEARPRRLVTLSGREISCVLLDTMLLYHPGLAGNIAAGTLEIGTETLRNVLTVALTANPLQFQEGDPKGILQVILETFLFHGGPAVARAPQDTSATPIIQHPLIALDLPGMELADLFVPMYKQWSTFEEVRVNVGHFPEMVGSLYNYLFLYIDRNFQEFFSRLEGGVSRLYFRGKPFKHAFIGPDEEPETGTVSGSRFKSRDEEPTLQTFGLDAADMLSHTRQRDSSAIYNYFSVMPLGIWDEVQLFLYGALPQIITDPRHPSFIGRYGLRPMRARSIYLSQLLQHPLTQAAPPAQPHPLTPQPAGAATWAPKAAAYATEAGLLPAHVPWFVAMIHAESSFQTDRASTDKLESNGSRSQGIAQFNTAGAPTNVGLVDPFDPDNALQAAARYWLQLQGQFGNDPRLIIAGYNAGPGAVRAAHGIPAASANHIRRVESYLPRYQQYGGSPSPTSGGTLALGAARPPAAPTTGAVTPAAATGGAGSPIETSKRWAALLRAWHDAGGELWSGVVVVRGHPAWNIGHRLLSKDRRGIWEAYIEGVHHRYDMRTGQFLTTIRYTRGWYLNKPITAQIWLEARTTVTDTSGGPPTLDPQTGEPVGDTRYSTTPILPVRPLGPPETEGSP
jgi:hypothetical protein